jgi:hypothetical protein
MISRRELRQQAMRQGVALGALEKDYVLALILERIYSDPAWHETLVFKGGTALNKVYKTQRLSLDLDFTARRPVSVDALRPALEIPEIQGQIKDVHEYHDALTIDRLGFGPFAAPQLHQGGHQLTREGTGPTTPGPGGDSLRFVVHRHLYGVGRDLG